MCLFVGNSTYKCIQNCAERTSDHFTYIDVGLKNTKAPFDQWKALYFHNYAYKDKGLNFGDKGPYIDKHKI